MIKRGVRGVGKVYGLGLVGWVSTSSGSFCNEGAVKAGIASPPPLSTLLPRLASGYFTCTRHHQSVSWTTEILPVLEILHCQFPLWKLSKASFRKTNMTILLNIKKQYNFRSNANDDSDDEDDKTSESRRLVKETWGRVAFETLNTPPHNYQLKLLIPHTITS